MSSHFSRSVTALLVFGIVSASALFVGLILHLVFSQNAVSGQERSYRALAVLNSISETARYETMRIANWDEAHRRLGPDLDVAWFQENIGVEQFNVMKHSAAMVLDGAGRFLVGAMDGREIRAFPDDDVAAAIAPSVRAAARTPGRSVGVFVSFGGRPAHVGIAAICTHAKPRACSGRSLVLVKPLGALVRDAALTTGWPDLNVLRGSPSGPSLAIPGPDGAAIAHLVWRAPNPGFVALREAGLLIACAIAIIALSVWGLIGRVRGVTDRLDVARGEAQRLADTDALTGIANRRAVHSVVEAHLRAGLPFHLISLDLDGFKEINDTLGHETGDALLIEMGRRIRSLVPQAGVAARLGGDEFAILLPRSTLEEAAELGHDLVLVTNQPFTLSDHVISISCSVGIAAGGRGMNSNEVFRRADRAMFQAKGERSGLVRVYTTALDEAEREGRDLDRAMRAGLARGEFHVVFQPVLSVAQGRFVGVEALLRWTHPERGPISPAVFIPVAERSRFIVELGEFVLRTACGKLADRPDLSLSVNLSPVQLLDDRLAGRFARVLDETKFDPGRLELEVTEGYLVSQEERAQKTLALLRDVVGVRISLDDFGSGYASIGFLRRFALDKIKIDQSFVRPIETDARARRMLLSIVGLCKAFEIPITAEGVETETQARLLREAGCDFLQGYFFARPAAELPLADESLRGAVA